MEKMNVVEMKEVHMNACIEVFMNTFSKEPWNDVYESREQVERFFKNHLNNNYFLGYVGCIDDEVVAISLGMRKPWIHGTEYYIDEFCVSYLHQGKNLGSLFLKVIEEEIEKKDINAIILNTDGGAPAEQFYLKNGFKRLDNLVILVK